MPHNWYESRADAVASVKPLTVTPMGGSARKVALIPLSPKPQGAASAGQEMPDVQGRAWHGLVLFWVLATCSLNTNQCYQLTPCADSAD